MSESLRTEQKNDSNNPWGRGAVEGHRVGEVPIITQIYYLTCPVFNKNVMMHGKKHRSTTHITRKEAGTTNFMWEQPDVGYNRKRLWNIHYKYVHKTKKSMVKEITEGFIAMLYQLNNTSKL